MQEEFHGIWNDGNGPFKLLYGWGTMSASVWLPSLSELVGTTGAQNTGNGGYYSAMQGLGISLYCYTDGQGGTQFAWFQQYNANGGGQKLWDTCNHQVSWLRSPDLGQSQHVTQITNTSTIELYILPTLSRAVHPARRRNQLPITQSAPLYKKGTFLWGRA